MHSCFTHMPPFQMLAAKEVCGCETCLEANATRMPSDRVATKTTEWGHLAGDLCGPLPPSWIDGFRYVLVAIEQLTGWIFWVPMKLKSDTPEALEVIERQVRRMPGKPKRVCCRSGMMETALTLRQRSRHGDWRRRFTSS